MAKIEGPTQSGRWKRWGAQIMYSLIAGVASLGTAMAEPRWEMLPETPELPAAGREGEAPVNGIKIWHAVYGSGEPVLMLHGGLGNSNSLGKPDFHARWLLSGHRYGQPRPRAQHAR